MADDKKINKQKTSDDKAKNVYGEVSKKFQDEFLKFIWENKEKLKSVVNKDNIISLFLENLQKKNTWLYKQFIDYLINISWQAHIENITFAHLEQLPICKDGRLSELFAHMQSQNFEESKQTTVFEVRKTHYTQWIDSSKNRRLMDKWDEVCKQRFWTANKQKLIKSNQLLPTLQRLFDDFFKNQCTTDEQKQISTHLSNIDNRPTIKTYLDAFEKKWENIKDKSVKDALLKDTNTYGKKTTWALTLDKSIARLTQLSLLEQWIFAREGKSALIERFDNTFCHTDIQQGIFKEYPRDSYLQDKNPHEFYTKKYAQKIKQAETEQEAEEIRAEYEKELMEAYFERVTEQATYQNNKTNKEKLIEQLVLVNQTQTKGFEIYKDLLKKTFSDYLKEDFLEQQLDHKMIKAWMEQEQIPTEYFEAYLSFWKQVYDIEQKQATFVVGEGEKQKTMQLFFKDKNLIPHPEKCTGPDRFDQLFSRDRTIDFAKSSKTFGSLFGNQPTWYITDDRTGEIIDTLDHNNDIAVYTATPPTLQNRIVLDKKNKSTVLDKQSWQTYTWYPLLDDEEDMLCLVDEKGETICTIPLINHHNQWCVDSDHFSISANTRTFSFPKEPPLITQLMQTALFGTLWWEKSPKIQEIYEQNTFLDATSPVRPFLATYTSKQTPWEDNKKAEKEQVKKEKEARIDKLSSYKFASTKDIPEKILKEYKKPETIKAWINQWEIFFHTDYFCKKYNLQTIIHENDTLVFVTQTGEKITLEQLRAWKQKNTIPKNLQNCLEELVTATTHEIAHRLFEFHDIQSLQYTTSWGETITLDQETLCEIADGMSLPKKYEIQSDGTKRWYVTINKNNKTHRIWWDELEFHIQQHINGFTRRSIVQLDANMLEEYKKDYDKFTDLVAANTANNPTPPTAPTVETVTNSRQVMAHRIQRFLEQLDDTYDPSNQAQVAQRMQAQQHLDALTQQEVQLNAPTPPSATELNQMHQAQVAANEFLNAANTPPSNQNNQSDPRNPNRTERPANQNQQSGRQSQENEDNQENENDEEWRNDTNEQWPQTSIEEEKNIFDKWFSYFKWDKSALIEQGTVIFLKENISSIPWRWFNRVKYTIKEHNDEKILLEMSDATEKNVVKKTLVELPRTRAGLHRLEQVGKWEVYKFGKWSTEKWWFIASAKNLLWGKWINVNNFKKPLQEKDSSKNELVSHVGNLQEKIVDSSNISSVLYKVDRWSTYVTVSSAIPDGDAKDQKRKALRTKKMDYDTFQMFCFTKSMNPLTATEVKRSGERLNPEEVATKGGSQGISLAAMRKGLKAIPEKFKKKWEEEEEFETALATDYFTRFLPNTSLLYSDEVKSDLSGIDGLVWQRISKFKSERSSTSDNDKANVHDVAISKKIKADVFNNIKDTRRFKYKAAGALLFALEKWGMYFRALSEYANKDWWWRWIKCILGESARQQFLAERQRKIDQYKSSGWTSDEIQSEIVKFELQFIENATKDKPWRWSKFWREIEIQKDNLYGGAGSIDPSSFTKKWDFPYMMDTFWSWWIGHNIPWLLFSTLEAMKGAVETNDHYSEFYKCIYAIFATWMVHMLPQDYILKLKWIGRSRWIPMALLAGDAQASGKSMRLLDYIARKANIKTFSEFSWYNLSYFDKLHIHNYTDKENHKKIRNSFANRRENYWWTVMDAFNYKNEYLITKPDSSEDPKTRQAVDEYLWKGAVFGTYKGIQNDEDLWRIDGQSPFFQEGILNLSEWAFKWYMMKFTSTWELVNPHSVTLRSNFSSILDQFWKDQASEAKSWANDIMAQLLYKKFLIFFNDKLWGTASEPAAWEGKTYLELFKSAIQGWTDDLLETLIRKVIFKERDRKSKDNDERYVVYEGISNGMVKDTILKFAHLVKTSFQNIKNPTVKANLLSEAVTQ